jgi:hypothetical protein
MKMYHATHVTSNDTWGRTQHFFLECRNVLNFGAKRPPHLSAAIITDPLLDCGEHVNLHHPRTSMSSRERIRNRLFE